MANSLQIPGSQCCIPSCADSITVQVPGPKGDPGEPCTPCTDGINAFTTTTADFTMPAELASVVIEVVNSDWMAIGQIVFVQFAGYFSVAAKTDSTHATITNLEDTANDAYLSNVPPGTVIPSGAQVSPGGLQGEKGADGSDAAFPTTTKGDIIVDDGANFPNASPQRLAVGTDGQALIADSGGGLGVNWGTLQIVGGGTGATNKTAALNNLSPLTTVGDIIGFDGDNVRLPVGADGEALIADSSAATGLKWGAGASSTNTNDDVYGSGTDFTITGVYAKITFGTSGDLAVTLPKAGTYLVQAILSINLEDMANYGAFKLRNTATLTDYGEVATQTEADQEVGQVVVSAIISTASDNETIEAWAFTGGASAAPHNQVFSTRSHLMYIRLA